MEDAGVSFNGHVTTMDTQNGLMNLLHCCPVKIGRF